MEKLKEEKVEAVVAWQQMDAEGTAAELADCLICVLAMISREGFDAEQILADKFELVRQKYAGEQPAVMI